MRGFTISQYEQLQSHPANIRDICIIAHVDHGKTTLVDMLLSSNGIISQRLAGKMRYMDSWEQEQIRGITMKSSSISLHYQSQKLNKEYLINVIDSPGHVDFSGEVSIATRLSDGAVVLVDVVEGVCPQTVAVLRQAWTEKIKPVLVINKIDRLITELKMEPMDAFVQIEHVLEQVNAICGQLYAEEVLSKDDNSERVLKSSLGTNHETLNEETEGSQIFYDWSSGLEDIDDSHIYFTPTAGNVLFASAIDGWGFRTIDFAQLYGDKFKTDPELLNRFLWGDFYFNAKTRRVVKGARTNAKKPMFVQFILENIWSTYEAVLRNDLIKLEKICSSLLIPASIISGRKFEPKTLLQNLFSKWLPLASNLLEMIVKHLPSPSDLSSDRVHRLLGLSDSSVDLPQNVLCAKHNLSFCDPNAEGKIIFVTKLFPIDVDSLPENKRRPLTQEEIAVRRERARQRHAEVMKLYSQNQQDAVDMTKCHDENVVKMHHNVEPPADGVCEDQTVVPIEQIALARIFSGTVRRGDRLYVIAAVDDYLNMRSGAATSVTIDRLYMLMGRELEEINEVAAGNVFGIGGLSSLLQKSATLSSVADCPSLTDVHRTSRPIVRVALEPENPQEMPALVAGLKILCQVDPCVQSFVQETGEHVIVTAGEVHLQRCVDDLIKKYARIPLHVSAPIVPFKETIVELPKVDMVNEEIAQRPTECADDAVDYAEVRGSDGQFVLQIKATPLPTALSAFLEQNSERLKQLFVNKEGASGAQRSAALKQLRTELLAVAATAGFELNVDRIWAFGPKYCGANILLNRIDDYERVSVFDAAGGRLRAGDSSVVSGFQIATLSGPLCEEPMMGVCFSVLRWQFGVEPSAPEFVSASGQLISAAKDACRRAFQLRPQRLVMPMFTCEILATADVLGKVYAVLAKRHGHVRDEQLRNGSNFFRVVGVLPVAESFGFADLVRKKTSGLASPQLSFSHWQVLEVDPFWTPTTDEEYAHFGEKADSDNLARKYVNLVRKRKGLKVDEKIVEFANKQRTLKKNK